mgnify:CR=1 FL=1
MDMVEAPGDSRLLSETEIGDTWVDTTQVWVGGAIQFVLFGLIGIVVLHYLGVDIQSVLALFIAPMGLTLIGYKYQRIEKEKGELDLIAISSGHPWHDSEDVGDTTVYVLDQGEQWIALESDVRIVTTSDPLLSHILLRDGDSEGEVLARCNFFPYCFSKVIAIINMAQALANAQDLDEDAEDSFESAREREETGEGLLEREWMDTEEGAVDYAPGAILRAFKRTLDGSSNDEDQSQDND